MILTNKQKYYLKGLAHHKKPVVSIGTKGMTKPVLAEIDSALTHHELIKVKLPGGDKSSKQILVDEICSASMAHSIGITGRTVIIFRQNDSKNTKIKI